LRLGIGRLMIPGIGYGRNAKVFIDNGINVTGIEISKTAIDLARQNGLDSSIYHGSVTDNCLWKNKRLKTNGVIIAFK